jgi:hypothetical protein
MDISGGGGGSSTRTIKVLQAADYPYQVLPTDDILILVQSDFVAVPTITLPAFATVASGKRFTLHRIDQNPFATVINAAAGENVDGAPTVTIPSVGTWSCDLESVGDDGIGFVKGYSFVNGSAAGAFRFQAGPTVTTILAQLVKHGNYVSPIQPYCAGIYMATTRAVVFADSPDQLQSYDTVCFYDTTGGDIVANLNGPSGLGQLHWLRNNKGAGKVVVTATGGAQIEGAATFDLLAGKGILICTDGADWWILADR